MLTSLALIFLVGMSLGWIVTRLRLPSLLGMLLTGILLGPYVLDLLDASILGISADLRQLALIIILTRAGLSLNLEDLKKVGRPAVLLCYVPACFEIVGMVTLAPRLHTVRADRCTRAGLGLLPTQHAAIGGGRIFPARKAGPGLPPDPQRKRHAGV